MRAFHLAAFAACLATPAAAGNISEVEQIGTSSTVGVQQTNGLFASNSSAVTQEGNDHFVSVEQGGTEASNISEILQAGDGKRRRSSKGPTLRG